MRRKMKLENEVRKGDDGVCVKALLFKAGGRRLHGGVANLDNGVFSCCSSQPHEGVQPLSPLHRYFK
jgi:hypothetical protein